MFAHFCAKGCLQFILWIKCCCILVFAHFGAKGCLLSLIVDLMLLSFCVCSFWCRGLPLIHDCGLNVAVFLCLLIFVSRVDFNL